MSTPDIVGFLAALAAMASFVPQIVKIARTHDASGVSLAMFGLTASAFVLWITYGWLTRAWPLVVSNTVNLALSATIAALRLRYREGDSASTARATAAD